MRDYYKIFKVSKNANIKEITNSYNKFKMNNQLSVDIQTMYDILSNVDTRKKYDELINKYNTLKNINRPFFGYDFDELYIKSYTNIQYEKKKYYIEDGMYLIYEKKVIDGKINKSYYIEIDGKIKLISEEKLNKIKNEYYNQKQINSELLKDSSHNKVLPK